MVEEVYQSRILGEYINIDQLQMGFFIGWVYTMAKTSLVENFEHK